MWKSLEEWLARKKKLGLGTKTPLFCNLEGKHLCDVAIRSALNRAAKKAHIEKRVHPHMLRHMAAHRWQSEGVPIGEISRRLGHHNVPSTVRYLNTHINPDWLVVNHRKTRELEDKAEMAESYLQRLKEYEGRFSVLVAEIEVIKEAMQRIENACS